MMLQILDSSRFDEETKSEIWDFLNHFDYIPFQQFPEHSQIENISTKYFIAREKNAITGWLQVVEKRKTLAVIEFGPIGDYKTVAEMMLFVTQYYKKQRYLFLRWVPYYYENANFAALCSELKSRYKLLSSTKLIHWSSKRISLEPDAEVILKKFSENHRRNIKKAISLNIECRKISAEKEVDAFVKGYVEMYEYRKLNVDPVSIRNSFQELHHYLEKTKRGFFVGAFKENILLGGLIIIFQGTTAFYHKGYIDHEQRTLPINHVAFYKAILLAKEENMQSFDFGGYASDTKDEQLININKFKDGFRGELVEFPKTQMIGLNYFSRWAHSLLSLKLILNRYFK